MTPSLRPILTELDSQGSHIVYNTHTRESRLYKGDQAEHGSAITHEDLITLFENAWISRYHSTDGLYYYRLTTFGREANQK